MSYTLRFTKQAAKDLQKLSPKLRDKAKDILRKKVSIDPYSGKPLVGDLKGFYSVRLSHKDRIVYSIHDDVLEVIVVRGRSHYGE